MLFAREAIGGVESDRGRGVRVKSGYLWVRKQLMIVPPQEASHLRYEIDVDEAMAGLISYDNLGGKSHL
jgi:hypothetical protein